MSNDKNRLKIGDIVTLRSGGPRMTIRKEAGSSKWECQWFTRNDELKSDTFVTDMLEPVAQHQPAQNAGGETFRNAGQSV